MDFNKFFHSKRIGIAMWCIVGLVVLLFVFRLGVIVGYKKASFSYRWGENYHRNFGGPRGGFFGVVFSDQKDFINSHGTFGQIIKIDNHSVVVTGKDNIEQIVLVKDDTPITRFRDKIPLANLNTNDYIVVIGEPNESGQIDAKLIRVMPPPDSIMRPPVSPGSWR